MRVKRNGPGKPDNGRLEREIASYAWRLALSALLGLLLGFTDTLIVANYSSVALAAVALGTAIYELPANILMGALVAHRILAPATYRDKQGDGLLNILIPLLCVTSLLIAAIPTTGALFPAFQNWLGVDTFSYLLYRSPALLFETTIAALAISLLARGTKRAPLICSAMVVTTNIGLDIVFVNGHNRFSLHGAAGAGVASSLSAALGALILSIWLGAKAGWSLNNFLRKDHTYSGWIRLSWPSCLSALLDYGDALLFVELVRLLGSTHLGGLRLGTQFHLLLFIAVSSLSHGALNVLSARRDIASRGVCELTFAVRSLFYKCPVTCGVLVVPSLCLVQLLFHVDKRVFVVALAMVAAAAVSAPFAGSAYADVTALRLLRKTKVEMYGNVIATWCIQLPAAYVFVTLGWGHLVFCAIPLYWVFYVFPLVDITTTEVVTKE